MEMDSALSGEFRLGELDRIGIGASTSYITLARAGNEQLNRLGKLDACDENGCCSNFLPRKR
jgi:hypothetical protein